MEKKTTLAQLRGEIHLQPEAREWFASQDKWYSGNGGEAFLQEYGGDWNKAFVESSRPVVRDFFSDLGLEGNHIPSVEVTDYYRGSWIIKASIVMYATIGTAYKILKGVSELPKIQDGLSDLKDRINDNFSSNVSSRYRDRLGAKNEQPPDDLIWTNTSIDARPVSGLTTEKLRSHDVNISISVSESSMVLENLSGEVMDELKIGIFKNKTEKSSWNFANAYASRIGRLSGGQTLTKDLNEFKKQNGDQLSIDNSKPVYLDCWVQDNDGIYLFNFYLE